MNYVERQALLCGFSTERILHDYGTDLLLFTYDKQGVIENGHLLLQLKATDSPDVLASGSAIRVALDRRDLLHWLNEPWPVILILYDGLVDEAYWVHVQAYFTDVAKREEITSTVWMTIHIPSLSIWSETRRPRKLV